MYVNAGSHAVKVLQCKLILFDIRHHCGWCDWGNHHCRHTNAARRAPDHLVDAYGIERVHYYLSLADARPSLRKFARTRRGAKGGWVKRAEKYMRPRFHLSPSVFQQRTAAWG